MIATLVVISAFALAPQEQPELKELLPGIRVGEKIVEFEGEVCINAHHPDTPDVYLEMLVTAPDSREHESLVMAKLKPSSLHAALLAAGFVSGSPLSRDAQGELAPAHGDPVMVLIAPKPEGDAEPGFVAITDWVVHVDDDGNLADSERWTGLVFAGSRFSKRGYEADFEGTLISLTSFGDEVIAPAWTVSDKAAIDEPVWIANRDLIPKKGTKVIVRIEASPVPETPDDSHEPDRVDIDRDP